MNYVRQLILCELTLYILYNYVLVLYLADDGFAFA